MTSTAIVFLHPAANLPVRALPGSKVAVVGSERLCVLQANLDPAMPLASVPVPQLAAFSEVCLACLQMDPKDRYASLCWLCCSDFCRSQTCFMHH